MKIAHIVCTYPPYYGGMGNVVFETASRLSGRGHTVEVFTPEYKRDGQSDEEKSAIEDREDFGRRLKSPIAYGNAAYLPELRQELDSFDLVHLHYPFFGSAGLVARWKKRNPHKPLVVTYHMDTRANGLKGLFFKLYAEWFMPSILSSADILIASSFDYVKVSDARDIYAKHREKWIELPFGVDTKRFQPREKPLFLFDRYNLNPELPTVIFVGGMDRAHYFKGVPVLLQALAQCQSQNMPLQAVLVGEGDVRHEYELIARSLGLLESVRFVGKISYEELPLHYAMGDVSVLPSTTVGEAFGMVLLESMATGIPVLASDLPGVRIIALEGGEVCTPGSATDLSEMLSNFFSSAVDREEMGRKARQVIEDTYDWETVIVALEKEYQKLIA